MSDANPAAPAPFALSLGAQLKTRKLLHDAAFDPTLASKLVKSPVKTLQEYGVPVSSHAKVKVVHVENAQNAEHVLYIPPKEHFTQVEALLQSQGHQDGIPGLSILLAPTVWGLSFVIKGLVDQITSVLTASTLTVFLEALHIPTDLASGEMNPLAAEAAAATAGLAAMPGTTQAVLELAKHWVMKNGAGPKGIAMYAPWHQLWAPPCWHVHHI